MTSSVGSRFDDECDSASFPDVAPVRDSGPGSVGTAPPSPNTSPVAKLGSLRGRCSRHLRPPLSGQRQPPGPSAPDTRGNDGRCRPGRRQRRTYRQLRDACRGVGRHLHRRQVRSHALPRERECCCACSRGDLPRLQATGARSRGGGATGSTPASLMSGRETLRPDFCLRALQQRRRETPGDRIYKAEVGARVGAGPGPLAR